MQKGDAWNVYVIAATYMYSSHHTCTSTNTPLKEFFSLLGIKVVMAIHWEQTDSCSATLKYIRHTMTITTYVCYLARCTQTHLSPSANFPDQVVEHLPPSLESGIYYGWASVDQGPVYKMVMSMGWNPHYHNEKRSMVCVCCVHCGVSQIIIGINGKSPMCHYDQCILTVFIAQFTL